ncbi:MAG: APC family permease [Candidatus Nanopelagicales bacterium]
MSSTTKRGVVFHFVALITTAVKRVLLGRAMRSDKLRDQLLPKRLALPVFSSDALSSNAYATQEIILVLSLGGILFLHYSMWIGVAVAFVMGIVVMSYRQNVHAYPSGGGDYENVTKNLGKTPGLIVASSLLIDYVVTVAVSIAAAVANLRSGFNIFDQYTLLLAMALIILLTLFNLRGIKQAGAMFAIPTYAFIFSLATMVLWGLVRVLRGDTLRAESAEWTIIETDSFTGFALAFLIARAFAAGSTALAGIEAVANGVPAFRKPKSKNAATTLLLLGLISSAMFLSITFLAQLTQVRITSDNARLIGIEEGYVQKTVIVQISEAVFSEFRFGTILVTITTALILILAANIAYTGFPVLASVLAQDKYLPRQMHTRGDRLAFSNGILILSVSATLIIFAFEGSVTRIIQLYIIGIFTAFTLGQTGMVIHWNRALRSIKDVNEKKAILRSRSINLTGLLLTGSVLLVVVTTKFTQGAWIVVVAIPILMGLMILIKSHYDSINRELTLEDDEAQTFPSRVHAIVLVSKVHKPTMRAVYYARATRPNNIEAVTVNVSESETQELQRVWQDKSIPIPLKVLDSPFREITRPVIDYVKHLRRQSPRDVVTIFIPEYVVGHWWEQLLHNQSALRLKTRLLFTPGVMVVSVPWQLISSEKAALRAESEKQVPIRPDSN